MKLNTYFDLNQTISKFQKRGFTRTFDFEGKHLRCIQTNKKYNQEELQIVEYHRFKTNKNQPQKSIIFAITSNDGENGYIISSEIDKLNIEFLQFMDKVKIRLSSNTISANKKNSAA